MFHNYLIAALRNFLRNRVYAAVNVVGLAVAFSAATFAALFVRDATTYNRWVPAYERIFVVATTYAMQSAFNAQEHIRSHRDAALWLKDDFPEIETATRYLDRGQVVAQRGDVRAIEAGVASADINLFSVLRVPVVAGDLQTALNEPDGIVLTRSLARKYFGKDAPVGEVIDIDEHPMTVKAVIDNFPSNSTFTQRAFISERAPFSSLRRLADMVWDTDVGSIVAPVTLVRLKSGASIEALQRAMPTFVDQHMRKAPSDKIAMRLLPLASVHLAPLNNAAEEGLHKQLLTAIFGASAIGALIVLAAIINFVNATTARASRRAVEVGVRKATGASRAQLVVQFVGESLIFVVLAALFAVALVVVLFPSFQAVLGRMISFLPWRDPAMTAGMMGTVLATGLLAGSYPAFVLSSFRPAGALKANRLKYGRSGNLRSVLVTVQFSILIGVMIVAGTVYRQTNFAMNESLRFDKDQVLWIQQGCKGAMKGEVQALPGVRQAACGPLGYNSRAAAANGAPLGEWTEIVDFPFFEVLGLKPLAGRFFEREYGEDSAFAGSSGNPNIVVNETVVRQLGFGSPEAAIGQTISWRRLPDRATDIDDVPLNPSRIIGVVADFAGIHETVFSAFMPRMYYIDPTLHANVPLQVKLTGHDVPETLRSIDELWNKVGDPRTPIQRFFIDQRIEEIYGDLRQQQRVISVFLGVALFISALGLFGLAAYTTERRTKEVGIRKAMGASRRNILGLLLWEFGKPVLMANAVAWPVAYFAMSRWLAGFAYHVDLAPWLFLASSSVAVAIAMLTVAGHVWLVARTQPVKALRYE